MSAATASPGAATARNEIIDVILGIVLTDQPDDFRTAAAIVDLASASMFFSSCVLRKISSHKKIGPRKYNPINAARTNSEHGSTTCEDYVWSSAWFDLGTQCLDRQEFAISATETP